MKGLFVALCLFALAAMAWWKLSGDKRRDQAADDLQRSTSDAASYDEYVTIWGDDWLGYCVFRSRRFQKELEKQRIGVRFDMEFDFKKRFEGLASGECDLVVATIDSYLVNGADENYPGVILFQIDESYGGDAIVGRNGVTSLDDLKKPDVKGALVGYSPSEFLLKSQISHFGIESLLSKVGSFRQDSAEDAYARFKSGTADFAVLWEPFVSKALAEVPGATRLIDTSKARDLILDVAIGSRPLIAEKPQVVRKVMTAYFTALDAYLADAEEFKKLARSDSGKSQAEASQMLAGIRFADVAANEALANGGAGVRDLADRITDIAQILVDVGDLKSDPFRGNPQLITNTAFLADLSKARPSLATPKGGPGTFRIPGVDPPRANGGSRFFRQLTAPEWKQVSDNITGTLVDRPIVFATGTATVPEQFVADLAKASEKLTHYPTQRIIVQAHVSAGSDPEADQQLSQQRAEAIRDRLIAEAKIPPERIHAMGMGSSDPVARIDGESTKAWKRRCRRARVFLAEDS